MPRGLGSRSIYVIGAAENPVKIGIAVAPEKRLMELQVGCPDELAIHHLVKVPAEIAQAVESGAHQELREKHRRGEWFNVHKDEALAVVQSVKDRLLNEYRWEMRGGDLLERLGGWYELRESARDAVIEYRTRLVKGDTGYVEHANGFVLKHAGSGGYAAFSLVIAQQKAIPHLGDNGETAKAYGALVRAINMLAVFHDRFRSQKAEQAMERRRQQLYGQRKIRSAA